MTLEIAKKAGAYFIEKLIQNNLKQKKHIELDVLRTNPQPSAEWQNNPDIHWFTCLKESVGKTELYEKTSDILPILFGEKRLKASFEEVGDYLATLSGLTPMDAFLLAQLADFEDEIAQYYADNGKINENSSYAWRSWNTRKCELAAKLYARRNVRKNRSA